MMMIGQFLGRRARDCLRIVSSSVRLQHHQDEGELGSLIQLSTPERLLSNPLGRKTTAVVSSLQPLSIPPTGSVILLKCQTNSSQWMNPATLAAHTQNKTYKLPSISPQKKSILDPSLNVNVHRLPTYSDITQDKLTPAWQTVVPIKEPENPGCQGEQILMPVMVRIRRRKMKTHKYKKMRKRLAFLLKRRREAKKKKQRKALELYRSKWMKMADEFDAEKFVSESISKAKEQNWSVDVVQDWYKSKSKAGA